MAKLLLTSAGLANQKIKKQFLQIIDKPASQIKIVFVPAAARNKDELKYADKAKKELINLGILGNNIKVLKLDRQVSFQEVKNFDVIYVCGGNTFYLLKKVRQSGFDKVVIDFVKSDKLYFGISAGSILAGPDISAAGTGSEPDKNDVNLTDLTGLNLINLIISPHYNQNEKPIIDEFKKKTQYKVVTLTDDQALVAINGRIKIIK